MMEKRKKSQSLQALKERRKQIDLIDRKLLKLLSQRLRIALRIGKIKKALGEKIYHPEREKMILESLIEKNKGPLKEEDLKKIFTTIMKVCRKSQT
ncbi:MAG: chorismate mutase [Thermodesulfobacteriota bacterium]